MEKSEVSPEKVDGGDDQPCLQLFGERVVSHRRDHDDETNDRIGNFKAVGIGKLATTRSSRLRNSSVVPSPVADYDEDDAGLDGGEEMRVVSSFHKGLTTFRQGGRQQRSSSLLERQILPSLSSSAATENGGRRSGDGEQQQSSAAKQLTVFYAGMVNVFDNIPAEKVEAIILLASELCCASKVDTKKMQPPPPCRPAGRCEDAEELPVARKISLQHFMEKRRLRIRRSKSPYFCSSTEQIENSSRRNGGMNQDEDQHKSNDGDDDDIRCDEDRHKISLSPFPSRSGYLLSSSTTN